MIKRLLFNISCCFLILSLSGLYAEGPGEAGENEKAFINMTNGSKKIEMIPDLATFFSRLHLWPEIVKDPLVFI